jgi:hypothetical protein
MQHNILPANCLDPNVADRTWKFSSLNNNGQGNIKTNNGNVEFVLNINPIPLPYKHTSLAWDDWITFSYESMAEWLNTCAAYIKQKDPSREVVCYNGCVFGTHTLGDFTTYWQRLDISLAKSPELDVYGVQVCIADRDYTMVTCPIDIARKYGKPIYLTDIVDFPYGLFSGFDPIYRGTLTAIQHGANGVFAYCWLDSAGGADYQFYKHLSSFELKKYVDDLCSAVKKVADYSVYTDIAFILPVMPYSLADNGGYKSDWLDIGGWCQLLNDMGIIADFYTPYELAEVTWDLSKYKMIIVPDCPVLPRKVNSNLVDYVKHGGTIALSATPPYKDLRNMPLKNAFIESIDQKTFVADKFVTNLANEKTPCEDIIQIINKPIEKSIEKGKVIWLREKLGKAYWGQARRNRIYGNTPPTYIKPHYTITAQILRENIRKSLNNLFSKYIRDRLVNFNNSSGSISIVPFLSSVDNYDDAILFVINNGNGRQPSTELKMSKEFTNAIGQVWIDFDRHSKITVNTDGSVIIPDFAHVSIINFRKDF